MIAKAKAISHGINDSVILPENHSTRNIRRKSIEYWTICYPLNQTLWGYGNSMQLTLSQISAYKEFCNQNRVEPIARTYPIL
mgnify:CR=1 FL=1